MFSHSLISGLKIYEYRMCSLVFLVACNPTWRPLRRKSENCRHLGLPKPKTIRTRLQYAYTLFIGCAIYIFQLENTQTSQGGPHGGSLTQFLWHEATESFASPQPPHHPPGGMLVHRKLTTRSMSPVPIYTPWWRETMWGKVPCQGNNTMAGTGRRTTDLKI